MILIYPPHHEILQVNLTGSATTIRDLVEALIADQAVTKVTRARYGHDWASAILGILVEGADCTVESEFGNGEQDATAEVEIPGGSAVDHTLKGSGTAKLRLLLNANLKNKNVAAAK